MSDKDIDIGLQAMGIPFDAPEGSPGDTGSPQEAPQGAPAMAPMSSPTAGHPYTGTPVGDCSRTSGGTGIYTPERFDMWTQHITSRFDSDGKYNVNMRYVMDTNRAFTEAANADSIVDGYTSPMYYRPHNLGDGLTVDGIPVICRSIDGRWLNDVQYELVEIWTSAEDDFLESRRGPGNLKNWTIEYSWVPSKYPVPAYRVDQLVPDATPPYNTAGDEIDVPVMVINITITGRWWQKEATHGAWGLNSDDGWLLGIPVPRHCGLWTKAVLPHAVPGSEQHPKYDGYDVVLKGVVSYDYMMTDPQATFLGAGIGRNYGGHDLLVPNMGYRELKGGTLIPILSGYEDQEMGVFPQMMSWLDANGEKIEDPVDAGDKVYQVFQLYPELQSGVILPGFADEFPNLGEIN